ncbi:MAG: hypothetical protein IIC60_12100, partial [Proteobacteria bacterium]|nr:hypothetical protein [Pseudomonadota bacterium]
RKFFSEKNNVALPVAGLYGEGLTPCPAPDEVRDPLIAITQFPKRLGDPKEFAEQVAHIVTCSYLNGETIRLDAGIRMPAI